jgi:MFS family permease
MSWGWRIPFLLSLLLIGIGLYIRLQLTESPLFLEIRRQARERRHPLATLVAEHRRKLFLGCAAKLAESTVFTTFAVLIVAYATSRGIPRPVLTEGTLIAILAELVALPLFGALADRIGRRPVYLLGAIVCLVLTAPVFALAYYRLDSYLWIGLVGVLSIGHAAMYGPQAAFFAELFPTDVRASGISFVQQIGALIGSGGGLAAGWLLQLDAGKPWALVLYVAGVALITIAGVWALPETAPRRTPVQERDAEAPFAVTAR